MNITQTFYDALAPQYEKLFADWQAESAAQAQLLEALLDREGFDRTARILDCACGIGTQAIGLAAAGFDVTASDISGAALAEAKRRARERGLCVRFARADFRALEEAFDGCFDVVIAMDNALPHMRTGEALQAALTSIAGRVKAGGLFAASIRDYDALLNAKPPYSPPYIHKTAAGQRVCFQTWEWEGERYRLIQYIIDDEKALQVSKFECEYRAVRRDAMTQMLQAAGFAEVRWKFPEETGFYQPIVTARK